MIFLPAQVSPFPLYPVTHAQVKLPGLLVQTAFTSQLPAFVEHSLMSGKHKRETQYVLKGGTLSAQSFKRVNGSEQLHLIGMKMELNELN